MNGFAREAATVAVFSHPNHELAVFGLVQSVRPWLVYLTDGGGEDRVEQTRQGLRSIGMLDRTRFLNFSEKSFYDALLDCDSAFYAGVAGRLRAILEELKPAQVLCDAVEFYNPVHDMSLPLVRAALRNLPRTTVFEVPLVYQKPGAGETYQVQRPADEIGAFELALDEPHVDAKLHARDAIYTILTTQLGDVITGIPREHLTREVIVPAPASLPQPDATKVLRYEWRARLLLERKEIERTITHADHYVPVSSALLASASPS